ncbi:TonB-dependent receptor, partial [Myxococcota bacterium]|nr:TonB-dependent receptor [Myxococcota bacterium]
MQSIKVLILMGTFVFFSTLNLTLNLATALAEEVSDSVVDVVAETDTAESAPVVEESDSASAAETKTSEAAEPAAPAAEVKTPAEASDGMVDIMEMNLDDLLDMPIVTASKRKEKMSASAAIVSLVTKEDVDSFGGLSLDERLSYLVGVELMETYYGYKTLTFRGNMQAHYNNKSLLLINGHPIFAPVTGTSFLAQIPQSAIESVEVVRGPGSTLYGTNAYAGVMNVITKKPGKKGFWEAHSLNGSHDTMEYGVAAGKTVGDYSFYLFADHHDSSGYHYEVTEAEEPTQTGEPQAPQDFFAYEDDRDAVYAGMSWKSLTLNAGYFTQKKDKFGLIPTTVSTGPRYINGWLADLSYKVDISETQDVSVFLRHDGYTKRELVGRYPPVSFAPGQPIKQRWDSQKSGAEVQYSGIFLEDALSLVAGLAFDYYQTDPYVFKYTEDTFDEVTGDPLTVQGDVWESASAILEEQSYHDTSAYLNMDYFLTETLKLAGGLRFNNNSDYGSFVAPRAGVVYGATDAITLKALYGRAYRAPSLFEKYVSTTNVLYGGDIYPGNDEVLDPEIIDSVDLSVEYRKNKIMARLVGFYMMTASTIGRSALVPTGEFDNTKDTPAYSNSTGSSNIYGAELELEARPITGLRTFFNATYRMGTSELDGDTTDR